MKGKRHLRQAQGNIATSPENSRAGGGDIHTNSLAYPLADRLSTERCEMSLVESTVSGGGKNERTRRRKSDRKRSSGGSPSKRKGTHEFYE